MLMHSSRTRPRPWLWRAASSSTTRILLLALFLAVPTATSARIAAPPAVGSRGLRPCRGAQAHPRQRRMLTSLQSLPASLTRLSVSRSLRSLMAMNVIATRASSISDAVQAIDGPSVAGVPDFLPSPDEESLSNAVEYLKQRGLRTKIGPAFVGGTLSMAAISDVQKGEPLMTVPSSLCVTRKDVDEDPILSLLSKDQDSLTALSLWIMKQRALGEDSEWGTYLKIVPLFTYSPITWTEEERADLLQGTTIKDEANQRVKALESRWVSLAIKITENSEAFESLRGGFNFQAFCDAFSVVLASAVELESVRQLALVPLTELLPRVPSADYSNIDAKGTNKDSRKPAPLHQMRLDYDKNLDAVTLVSDAKTKAGEEVFVTEPYALSNAELLLQRGKIRGENPNDFLVIDANIVMADALYGAKKQILEAYGLSENQKFIVYSDRIPLQLLSYLRLSRLQSTDDLLKLDFENDKFVSEMNEYEILQLLLGEARMISGKFKKPDTDSDRFVIRDPEASVPEKLAATLRLGEKKVVSSFMDAVRTRLAPIRGIPTKKGMENQNQEILDMFDTFESIPKAPGRLVKSLTNWWTDERNWKDDEDDIKYNK